jgi:hypothetical protein
VGILVSLLGLLRCTPSLGSPLRLSLLSTKLSRFQILALHIFKVFLAIKLFIYMRRDRDLYNYTFMDFARPVRPRKMPRFKNCLLSLTKYEELEYVYTTEGRCSSHRSRGKISSILVRNTKYGVEQRFFLFNPRLIVQHR